MQLLADFETRLLRIPSININAGMIGANTLGYYDDETNEIFINTKHLDRSSACILRRAAATDAESSGHPADLNGHPQNLIPCA